MLPSVHSLLDHMKKNKRDYQHPFLDALNDQN
jgi:hypothetical protein